MKILITENQFNLLKEIGDNSHSLDYIKINDYKYKFIVEGYPLLVVIQKVLLNKNQIAFTFRFGSELNGELDPKHKVLNLGKPLKTMGTLSKIIFNFLKEENPDILFFHAARKYDTEDSTKNQRLKLYELFLTKAVNLIPEYNISKVDRVFIISKKEISVENYSTDILNKNYKLF